jgi:glycosyltransferase involved in cell wall biosynthesis
VPPEIKVAVVAAFPPPPGGMTHQAQMLAEILARDGARVVEINTNPFGRRKPRVTRLWHVLRELRKLRGCRLAIIFAGSYASFFAFSAVPLAAARLFGVPAILMYKGGLARPFLRRWGWLARPFLRMARAVVVPGRYLQNVLANFSIGTKVIPDVIDVSRLPANAPDPGRPPLVLVPRRHDYVGGVDIAVRAFGKVVREFPEAELHLCGDGAYRPELERLADEVAPGRVRFHGFLPHDELVPFLRDAAVVVNPTRDDNHPNSVLEAMWAGAPLAASAVGGVPFLVRDGETGFLAPPDDPEALAEKIIFVLGNEAAAREAAARGREAVAEFIWPYDRPGLLQKLLEAAGLPPTRPAPAS